MKLTNLSGKKNILAKWLHHTGVLHLLDFGNSKKCIVVNYHRIRASCNHGTLFDDAVFGPDQEEFEKQLRWLTNNNDILSEEDLISVVQGGYLPPRRGVVITFDDGYIDNYTVAYPVLRKYHAPAIFFVPTQSIEDRRLGWWDCFAYMLKTTRKKEIMFDGKCLQPKIMFQEAMQFVLHLVDQNKQEVDVVLDNLRRSCEVGFPDQEVQGSELMSWEQLREMSGNGISIGAHTHSHRVLSSLDLEQQKVEIEKSKTIIEQRLGVKVRSLSYPVGNVHHFSEDTKKIVCDAGYDLAFSFLTGVNSCGDIDPMDIKRISVSRYFPRFVSSMVFPHYFSDNL